MAVIIACQDVSKAFVFRTTRQCLLKDRALAIVRPQHQESRQLFWALRDVGFAVERGETFGIMGPNSAGEITLFRIVSGIFRRTAARVRVRGRMAPLLALGVGFHPELTGRENIYLSAALFAFTTREIRAVEGPSSSSPSGAGSSMSRRETTRRGCSSVSASPSPSR